MLLKSDHNQLPGLTTLSLNSHIYCIRRTWALVALRSGFVLTRVMGVGSTGSEDGASSLVSGYLIDCMIVSLCSYSHRVESLLGQVHLVCKQGRLCRHGR